MLTIIKNKKVLIGIGILVISSIGVGFLLFKKPAKEPFDAVPVGGTAKTYELSVEVLAENVLISRNLELVKKSKDEYSGKVVISLENVSDKNASHNLRVVEVIPKEFAQKVDEIEFSISPTKILADDAALLWVIEDLEANETKEISYSQKKSSSYDEAENIFERIAIKYRDVSQKIDEELEKPLSDLVAESIKKIQTTEEKGFLFSFYENYYKQLGWFLYIRSFTKTPMQYFEEQRQSALDKADFYIMHGAFAQALKTFQDAIGLVGSVFVKSSLPGFLSSSYSVLKDFGLKPADFANVIQEYYEVYDFVENAVDVPEIMQKPDVQSYFTSFILKFTLMADVEMGQKIDAWKAMQYSTLAFGADKLIKLHEKAKKRELTEAEAKQLGYMEVTFNLLQAEILDVDIVVMEHRDKTPEEQHRLIVLRKFKDYYLNSAKQRATVMNEIIAQAEAAPQTLSADITAGLVAYWKFDETSGDTVSDSSGNNNNGTLFGPTRETSANCKFSNCLSFDGDSYVSTNLDVQPRAMAEATWSVWVYPSRVNHRYRQQIMSDDNGDFDRSILIDENSASFGVFTGPIPNAVWRSTSVNANQWQHIVVVWGKDNVYFYKNGIEYSFGKAPFGQSTSYKLNIGRNPGFRWEEFQGRLDDIRVYNRALSHKEINQLYSKGASAVVQPTPTPIPSGPDITAGLISYWKFDETSGNTAYDSSGNNNNGTLVNSPTRETSVSCKSSACLSFNGSNEYVSTNLDVQPKAITESTWVAWVYPARVNHTYRQQIMSDDDGDFDRSILIDENSASFSVFAGPIPNGGVWRVVAADLNQWQHIAVVWRRDGFYFYKNGVEYTSTKIPFDQSTNNKLHIGNNPGFHSEEFQGRLDDVRVYNHALSANEIQQLYERLK